MGDQGALPLCLLPASCRPFLELISQGRWLRGAQGEASGKKGSRVGGLRATAVGPPEWGVAAPDE